MEINESYWQQWQPAASAPVCFTKNYIQKGIDVSKV